MTNKLQYQIAVGSVVGRDHVGRGNLLTGRNNQDAYGIFTAPDLIVATVHDGCSAGAHSEVGAQFAARVLPRVIATHVKHGYPSLSGIQRDSVDQLRRLALDLSGSARQQDINDVVRDYLQFTVIGAIITPAMTYVLSFGDGFFVLNGEVAQIGPYPQNMPPYLGYCLTDVTFDRTLLKFNLSLAVLTRWTGSLVIGTDGLKDLIEAQSRLIPGSKEEVGPLSQFWQNDRYFAGEPHKELITARLRKLNSEVARIAPAGEEDKAQLSRESGLLPDDTTMVVIRRAPK